MAYTPPDNDSIDFVLNDGYTPPDDDINFVLNSTVSLQWANSLKMTIDNTNIDSNLTHFPIPIVLSSSAGQSNEDVTDVFDKLAEYPVRPASVDDDFISATTSQDVDDDFTGEDGDLPNTDLWTPDNQAGQIQIVDNKARFVTTSALGSNFLFTDYQFSGDFDVQVDFEVSADSVDTWLMGIAMSFLESAYAAIDIRRQSNTVMYHSDSIVEGSTLSNQSSTSDTSGKLRITRVGTTFTSYYWNGSSWTSLHTRTVGSSTTRQFRIQTQTTTAMSITGYFDNYQVNSGTIVWPEQPNSALWNVNETGNSFVTSVGDVLQFAIHAEAAALTNKSIFKLTGDFDIQIDFDIGTMPATHICLVGFQIIFENGDSVCTDLRYQTEYSGYAYSGDSTISSVPAGDYSTTTDTSGKLQITRTGTTAVTSYWNGSSWTSLYNVTVTTDDVIVCLRATTTVVESFTGTIDNFTVNSGTIVWPELNDTFTGEDGDLPNTDLWYFINGSMDGTIDIQSNKLRLVVPSTANDEYITVYSNFYLSGDFDIQIDYEEISSDPPTSSTSYPVELRVGTSAGYIQDIKIYLTSSEYKMAYDTSEISTVRSIAAIPSGKFRITRVGATITCWYWNNSQWEWDGGTAGASATGDTSDCYVRLKTSGDFNSGCTSEYDNFQVNSGTIVWPENTHPNRRKIAITQDDGATQLYGEIEHWDSENKKAVIWASSKDLILSNSATTDLYLYYDPTKENNDNYIGDTSTQNIVTNIEEDTFTGVDEDSPNTDLWEVQQNDNSYLAIRSNKLNFSSPGTDINVFGRVRSIFTLFEDFDIQIDWDYTTLDAPDAGVTYAARLMLKRQSDDQWVSDVSRIRTSTATSYASQGTDASWATYATTDTLGKFRAVRSSGVITIYIWSGTQWEWNGSTSGRQVDDSETGDLYVFFEFEQENNGTLDSNIDNFIINSGTVKMIPSNNVWDNNYKAVYHMAQDPSGGTNCILDSTINTNHGTPGGTMLNEDLVDGDIGKAIDFDGTDDYIGVPNDFGSADDFTVEVKINFANRTLDNSFIGIGFNYTNDAGKLIQLDSTSEGYKVYSGNQNYSSNIEDTALRWAYIVMTCASDVANLYKDLTQIITNYSETPATWETTTLIGTEASGSSKSLIGKIAEVRLSGNIRSAAWLKATDYAYKDNMITFSFETTSTKTPIMMIIIT